MSDLCKYYFISLSVEIIPHQNWETGYKMASTRYSMIHSDLPFSHKMLIGNKMKILRICKLLGGFALCQINISL